MNKSNAELHYDEMEFPELINELELFRERIRGFFEVFKMPHDLECQVSGYALADVIERTDKRKAYYHCFHGMEIDECKVAALYAYWILMFHPLTITDSRYKDNRFGECINEAFAIYIIFSTISGIHDIRGIPLTPNDDTSYFGKLMYSFRYRNISIDSMILLAESINEETLKEGKYESDFQ
jgi:hypothetical protein